jgi:hypothetical protein
MIFGIWLFYANVYTFSMIVLQANIENDFGDHQLKRAPRA